MKRITAAVLSLFLSASMLCGCSAKTASSAASASSATSTSEVTSTEVTITDHADRTVKMKTNPKRAVILDIYPLASVLSVYLNSAETIVGMEPASMNAAKNGILSELYPEILNADTDIMDGESFNVESVAALKPDVVYYNASNTDEQSKLENAGLTAVGVSCTKFKFNCTDTYNEWMDLLDQIYPGRSETKEAAKKFANNTYDTIQSKVADVKDADKQKVLFLYQMKDGSIITSGKNFFGQWWCDATGSLNVATDVTAEKTNAVVTMEQIYSWNPDVIFITNFTDTVPDDLYNNANGIDWSSVAAVQNKRVYKMPLGTYRTFTPGADTPMTLEWMAQKIYPDLFDNDLTKDVKKFYKKVYGITITDDQIAEMYNPSSDASQMN